MCLKILDLVMNAHWDVGLKWTNWGGVVAYFLVGSKSYNAIMEL